MITYENFKPTLSYYAAANTHNGFHSEFDSIFAPQKFEKIFIFKGGPGTGKSSIMKGIVSQLCDRNIPVHAIYCSSDPKSLDGVIADNGGKRIAFLDGTAPHATDPHFPGAIEQIVNLGESFDIRALRESRDTIIALNGIKKRAYKEAYSALSLAGKIFDHIWSKINESALYNEAESAAEQIFKSIRASESCTDGAKIYTSAFSKYGYTKLPFDKHDRQAINICGERYLVYTVMNLLYQRLSCESAISTYAPSPLDTRLTDRIYTNETVIGANEDADASFDLSDIKCDRISNYKKLYEMYDSTLNMAAEYFKEASDAHFKIEDIYIRCMDFSNNDRIYEKLLCEL